MSKRRTRIVGAVPSYVKASKTASFKKADAKIAALKQASSSSKRAKKGD